MSNMRIRLSTLTFDAAGQGEKSEFAYAAHYEERGGECRLSFRRAEEGVSTKTVLTFQKEAPEAVTMRERGGGEAELRFVPGTEQASVYRVPGAGEFTLTLRTARVENTLSPTGGRLRLDYETILGGARQRILLTLLAEEG